MVFHSCQKSDWDEDVVWSKDGKGAPCQTYEQTSNHLHMVFMYESYNIGGKIVNPIVFRIFVVIISSRNYYTLISLRLREFAPLLQDSVTVNYYRGD